MDMSAITRLAGGLMGGARGAKRRPARRGTPPVGGAPRRGGATGRDAAVGRGVRSLLRRAR